MLAGDCGNNIREALPDRICQISESCSQMVLQFHNQVEVSKSMSKTSIIAHVELASFFMWLHMDCLVHSLLQTELFLQKKAGVTCFCIT